MSERAQTFEANREHLRAVAFRLLGNHAEADDAVQEAWLRFDQRGTPDVRNVRGWLTTVVTRLCLDVLRARRTLPADPPEAEVAAAAGAAEDTVVPLARADDPEHRTLLADSVSAALLVVLDTLSPAERVAFVLHDVFELSFDEIAPIVGRSPVAARQLASRARRRVQEFSGTPPADRARHAALVHAFIAAAHQGDLQQLLSLLDPDVVVRADVAAVKLGATAEASGAEAVARIFASSRRRGARPALIDGWAGAAWFPGGAPRLAFVFTTTGAGRISGIEVVAEPARLAAMRVEPQPE